MPSTRQRTPIQKRTLRNGALLAVSKAAKLVNVPLVHDVARHIRQVAVALKPWVLQAPKANDLDAQELAKHVEGLMNALNTAVSYLENSGVSRSGANGNVLEEIHQLHTHLSDTHAKLQKLQTASYTTKLASQTEIREGILLLEKDLSRTIIELTLRLLVVVLSTGAHNQLVIVQRLHSTAREHKALVRDHKTLARKHNGLLRSQRITQRRQRTSDKTIRRLDANCKGLEHQVNAMLLMRRTDEQRIAYLVLLNGASFFFICASQVDALEHLWPSVTYM
ncbi:unnamed protein product [Rhizoctonia solani]|uniref:Uncharacterized protein n=1 Tax=Rhizoctonia solani TaxID=456999 RepID=A0A8H3AYL9_9AGAM|nr:unnamed protein product [Rhizoctonia solani]